MPRAPFGFSIKVSIGLRPAADTEAETDAEAETGSCSRELMLWVNSAWRFLSRFVNLARLPGCHEAKPSGRLAVGHKSSPKNELTGEFVNDAEFAQITHLEAQDLANLELRRRRRRCRRQQTRINYSISRQDTAAKGSSNNRTAGSGKAAAISHIE